MKLKILAVGKMKEKWLQAAVTEYKKRLSRFVDIEITEVADSPDNNSEQLAMRQEGERLLAKINPSDYVVLVDLHGHEEDSIGFSQRVINWQERSGGRLLLVIAGSQGFDPAVRERAQDAICLSKLTFPHQLVRVLLLEQLFRAYKIANNENYHK